MLNKPNQYRSGKCNIALLNFNVFYGITENVNYHLFRYQFCCYGWMTDNGKPGWYVPMYEAKQGCHNRASMNYAGSDQNAKKGVFCKTSTGTA